MPVAYIPADDYGKVRRSELFPGAKETPWILVQNRAFLERA